MEFGGESFKSRDGLTLSATRAEVENPRDAVVVLHGYGDHMARFAGLTGLFNRLGLSVYLFDQRGHGQSAGPRGAVKSWEDYLLDLDAFLELAGGWHGSAPGILFGHSMGGLVAASYLLSRRHPFHTAVLSSPLFRLALEVGGLKLLAAKLASRLLPGLSLPTEIRPSALCHDPEVCRAYAEDPLVHKVANSRWFMEMAAAKESCLARAGDLQVGRLLIVHGEADRVVSIEGSKSFFSAVPAEGARFISYPGLMHEIYNETEKARPLKDLEDWLAAGMQNHAS